MSESLTAVIATVMFIGLSIVQFSVMFAPVYIAYRLIVGG